MEPPSRPIPRPKVELVNESRRPVPATLLKRAVSGVLSAHGHAGAEVCLLITSDERVRELNREFRGVDESTDVLSFPSGLTAPDPLGDLAISLPYAARQAAARGVALKNELAFLAIHGALHLVGFEDEQPDERALMIREMNRAASAVGLPPDDEWASILQKEAAWA